MVRQCVVAGLLISLILVVANYPKFKHGRLSPSHSQVQVVAGREQTYPTLKTSNAAAPAVIERAPRLTEFEARITDLTFNIMKARREARHRSRAQGMSLEEFRRRTIVACTDQGCLITASPGKGSSTSRELVALLVTLEAGLGERELGSIGLHAENLKARMVNGTPFIDLKLTRLM